AHRGGGRAVAEEAQVARLVAGQPAAARIRAAATDTARAGLLAVAERAVLAARAVRLDRVARAFVADAVAGLGDVAGTRRRAADVGDLQVGAAQLGAAAAHLGEVAGPRRGAAHGRVRLHGIGRALAAHATAGFGDVADLAGRRGAAHRARRQHFVRRAVLAA